MNDRFLAMIEEQFGTLIRQSIESAYQKSALYGLRFNNLKHSGLDFKVFSSDLDPNIYIPDDYKRAVVSPFNHGGAYYLQDPTAMMPVIALNPSETDWVLDLCAAPGGKSTQILNSIPEGLLLANEFDKKRSYRLKDNCERWGHENYMISQIDGKSLPKLLGAIFDKIVLDAPCSGEGLFRRMPEYMQSYQPQDYQRFVPLQKELLDSAYHLCIDDAVIVYSTCTLNIHENEEVIEDFLIKHPDCLLEKLNLPYAKSGMGIHGSYFARYFPSHLGEGHFIAKIRVKNGKKRKELKLKKQKETSQVFNDLELKGYFHEINGKVFYKRSPFYNLDLPLISDGIELGNRKARNFVWHHSVAMNPSLSSLFPHLELSLEKAYRYLYGSNIESTKQGYFIVTYQGIALGFAKGNGAYANNHYPKHLRNRFISYPG